MNITRLGIVCVGWAALVLTLGCAPRKQATERERKEAAHMVSEAQFAITIREWSRAEDLLAKAVKIAPSGDYWLSLGATRVRLNNRPGAKDAYQSALKSYEEDSARNNAISEPLLMQAYVFALLGRHDASRAMIEKAAKRFPDDGNVRPLTDPKEFEKMLSSQKFKDMAL
jgi:tetratricopeptide (TPR) repeat protein